MPSHINIRLYQEVHTLRTHIYTCNTYKHRMIRDQRPDQELLKQGNSTCPRLATSCTARKRNWWRLGKEEEYTDGQTKLLGLMLTVLPAARNLIMDPMVCPARDPLTQISFWISSKAFQLSSANLIMLLGHLTSLAELLLPISYKYYLSYIDRSSVLLP